MSKVPSGLTRRTVFLGLAGAGVAGTATFGVIGAPRQLAGLSRDVSRATGLRMPLASLATGSFEDWQREVGSMFVAQEGFTLRLAEVEALPSPGARPRHLRAHAFVANFDVVSGTASAAERIYNVNHALFGAVGIFMSAPSAGRLTAVFN